MTQVMDSSLQYLPTIYHSLVDEIKIYNNGHPPSLLTSNDPFEIGTAFLSEPSLQPSLIVPQTSHDDWSKVGYGLIHLLRSLKGIPRLSVLGTQVDEVIANDINNEIEYIAIINELSKRELPIPSPIDDLPGQISIFLENINDDILPANITFRALQLFNRIELNGAEDSLDRIENYYPESIKNAKKLKKEIENCDLSVASGKERVCQLAIEAFDLNKAHFYLREYGISKGKNISFGLGHYQAIERWKDRLENFYDTARSYVEFTLPFSIPVKDGLYSFKETCILIEHVELDNPRASWVRNNVVVEPHVDQSGLYGVSKITMILAGEKKASCTSPPSETIFRIFQSYSPLLIDALEAMNGFLVWARKEYKRPGIPNMNLLHFNRVKIKIFNDDGKVIRDIPLTSNEIVTITAGPPSPPSEELEIRRAEDLAFYLQLLDQAKLDCIETNPRRAILDLFGAFESFADLHLTTKMDSLDETTKQRFIRLYKNKLPTDMLELIESINIKNEDPYTKPSIAKIVREYTRKGCSPELNTKDTKAILKVINLRNDAAHGRKLPFDMLEQIANAIEAFERMFHLFEISVDMIDLKDPS